MVCQDKRTSVSPSPCGKGELEGVRSLLLQRARIPLRQAELPRLQQAAHDLAAAGPGYAHSSKNSSTVIPASRTMARIVPSAISLEWCGTTILHRVVGFRQISWLLLA